MKKLTKRIWAVALAVVMMMAMTVTAMADGKITITPPDETDANTTTTYKIYKVFDADGNGTNISYKLPSGKEELTEAMKVYFEIDSAGNVIVKDVAKDTDGNLTSGAIDAIAAFVQGDSSFKTVTTIGTTKGEADGFADGYYYVSTTTGTAVTVSSANHDIAVYDKNTVTEVTTKTIVSVEMGSVDNDEKNALAQLGTTVSYSVTVKFGKGAKNIKLHDTLGSGLTYNNDAKVTWSSTSSYEYTIKETPETGDTLTICFNDGIPVDTIATITYSATVNSDALTKDTGKNTAHVTYGDSNSQTGLKNTNVYNAKLTVTSQDGNGNALAGAGFVIKNADGKYYKKDSNTIAWVDSIADATEYTSDAQGAVTAFTGLANGSYTLVEKTVPSGYNKAVDSKFTIAANDYTATNLAQTATVKNIAGAVFPSTGGMGTTMFYVIGAILVLGAGVLLVTRKRMSEK